MPQVQTLTGIAGTYGLPQINNDAFSSSEQTMLDTIKKSLAELRSSQVESLAARGLGRSSFGEQAILKQEGDILSNMYSQFANARLSDVLNQQSTQRTFDYNRQLAQYQKGLASDLANQSFQNQLGLGIIGKAFEESKPSGGEKGNLSGVGATVGSAFGPIGSIAGSILGSLFKF